MTYNLTISDYHQTTAKTESTIIYNIGMVRQSSVKDLSKQCAPSFKTFFCSLYVCRYNKLEIKTNGYYNNAALTSIFTSF